MKKLIAISTIAVTLAAVSAFAQGNIIFANNSVTTVKVGDGDITGLLSMASGSALPIPSALPAGVAPLRIGLYFSLTENGTYSKVAETGFLTGATSQGRFSGGTIPITGVASGTPAWFQVRVWESTYGADYEAATAANNVVNNRTAIHGVSNFMNLAPNAPISTPLSSALQSFSVTAVVVPEPSTIALGILGLAGLFIIRRRQ